MSDVQTNNGKVERVWQDGTSIPAIPRLEFDELIARLLERRHAFTRYQVLDEIGRGAIVIQGDAGALLNVFGNLDMAASPFAIVEP